MILSHIKQFLYQFWSALICSKGPPCFQPPICSALPVFIKKWPQNVLIHNIQEHPRCFTQRGSVLTKLLVWKSIYLSKPVKSSSVLIKHQKKKYLKWKLWTKDNAWKLLKKITKWSWKIKLWWPFKMKWKDNAWKLWKKKIRAKMKK